MHKRTRIPISAHGSTPSKHPILHPITADALAAFTHPRCNTLGQVVRHPETKAVMVANGCIALRVTRGPIEFDDRIPAASATFTRRIDALPWARFQPDPNRLTPHEWRGLDDLRGLLYGHGLEELWIPRQRPAGSAEPPARTHRHEGLSSNISHPPSPIYHLTKAKPIWTAQSILIPLALLQLVARLPRVELRIDHAPDFALIRFSGGEGIIANRYRHVRPCDIPAHIFSIFTRPAHLPGGFTKP